MTGTSEKAALDDRLAGTALFSCTILSVVAMGHHPSNFELGTLSNIVHGAMLVVVVMTLSGFAYFASGRGLGRFSVLVGLVVYAAGAVANIMAATINGFAVVDVARHDVSNDIFAFAWALNQAFAYGAVYATSAAFTLWGLDLVARECGWARRLGVVGLIAGIVPAAMLAGAAVHMDVAGAFTIYVLQSIFAALVGIYLLRGRR
ncbi:MAG: hypothetical protein ACK4X1_13195 [Terricaulis sp.]